MNGGELTTKDIMKHFSDRNANGHGPRHFTKVTEVMPGRHENMSRPPPIRRMETDPSSWQEGGVRPVQDPPQYGGGPQGTPPQRRGGPYDGPASPYAQYDRTGNGTPDSGERTQPRLEWRNSSFARQNSGLTTGTV
jgi:hypothetical protein